MSTWRLTIPRQPRFVLPGHPQHVIIRGNNRIDIFRRESDYIFFLEKLNEAITKFQCKVRAYLLMTNHVHFLVSPQTGVGLPKVMQSLGRSYVQYFNKKYRRTETLWQGRYKAALVDSEAYAITCYRYIELNPMRAKMVESPDEYRWSSYHYNAKGKSNRLITPHEIYQRLGLNKEARVDAYQDLFTNHITKKQIALIRDATNKCWAIGRSDFLDDLSVEINRPLMPILRGGDRRSKNFNRV